MDKRKAVTADEIDVPEEMVMTVSVATGEHHKCVRRVAIEVLAWVSSNPQEPTIEDHREWLKGHFPIRDSASGDAMVFAVWWQRRMYRRREPAIHPELKALLATDADMQVILEGFQLNYILKKAYEIGKRERIAKEGK